MARLTLQEALKVAGGQILDPLTQQLGIPSWQYDAGGLDQGGNSLNLGIPDAQKLAALQGYTFDWQDTGPENTGTLIAYDPSGAQVGSFFQQDQSLGSALGEWAALAAAGFGGVGLLGLGPLGGALGGLSGAGTASGITAPGAGNLAAYGATLTPAEIAATAGVNFGGAGAAGAAGAAGTAGGAAAQAGFWGNALKIAAPVLGSVAGGLFQSNAAGKAANAQTAAARAGMDAIQKALAPYQQAGAQAIGGQQDLLGLNGPEKQQAAIDAIQRSPQFTSLQQQGENRILANASATGGLRGGNVQGALGQFSPQLLSQLIDQQYTRLGGLTTTGANAAAGVGTATANLQGQIGSAQAGQALANGSALTNVLGSGLGALGQYLGSQPAAGIAPAISTNTPFGQFQLGGGF